MWKIFGSVLAIALVAAQAVRPQKNTHTGAEPNDLLVRHPAPPAVTGMLQTACYDCHSNHTRYPWYAELQPFGWYLASHVRDGKAELNLSEFGTLSPKRQVRKLRAMTDEITDGSMPLASYTLLHRDARLSEAQRTVLTDWIESVADDLEAETKQ